MLNLHATAHATALLTPTPMPSSPAAPTDGSGAPSAFARMLQGSQPPAAAPSAAPAPKHERPDASSQPPDATGERAHDSASPAQSSTNEPAAQPPSQGAREAARSRDDAKRNAAAKASAQASANHANHTTHDAEKAKHDAGVVAAQDDAAAAQDPALASWLASLKLPDPQQPAEPAMGAATPGATADADPEPLPPPASDAATTASVALPAADTAAVQAAAGQSAMAALSGSQPAPGGKLQTHAPTADNSRERAMDTAARGAATADAATAALASAVQSRARQGDAQSGPGGQGHADKSPAAWTPVSSESANLPQPASPLPMQIAAFTAAATRPAREPATVNVPTPVDSPEFPRAMGVELAVLARNGVEQAELHLTPAEMGPVSVQISIDGTQARIEFGADMASTRQAIEAGLPELASALREAGLTLTGGGVSQHSRGQSNGGDAQGAQAGRGFGLPGGMNDSDPAAAAPAPARRFVRAGGVDMYA